MFRHIKRSKICPTRLLQFRFGTSGGRSYNKEPLEAHAKKYVTDRVACSCSRLWFILVLLLKSAVSTTVYKTRIGDVAFVAEPETGKKDISSETYILMFPEEPPTLQPETKTTEPIVEDSNQPIASDNIIIRPGDNLFRIALEYYGDGNYYSQLAAYNNIQNPNLIPVGLSLEIPPHLRS